MKTTKTNSEIIDNSVPEEGFVPCPSCAEENRRRRARKNKIPSCSLCSGQPVPIKVAYSWLVKEVRYLRESNASMINQMDEFMTGGLLSNADAEDLAEIKLELKPPENRKEASAELQPFGKPVHIDSARGVSFTPKFTGRINANIRTLPPDRIMIWNPALGRYQESMREDNS